MRIATTILTLLCLVLASGSHALSNRNLPISVAPFARDLTSQTIVKTYQDSQGYLWFLAQEGLYKYDGFKTTSYLYNLDNPNSISSNTPSGITEDKHGQLWISSRGGGLSRYNATTDEFDNILSEGVVISKYRPLDNFILSLFADREGILWLGYENAFSSFDPDLQEFTHYSLSDPLSPSVEVNGFAQSSDGTIWIATYGAGLLSVDPITKKVMTDPPIAKDSSHYPSNKISVIRIDKQDNLWLGHETAGITRHNLLTDDYAVFLSGPEPGTLSSNRIIDLFVDSDTNLWAATANGLNVLPKNETRFLEFHEGNSNLPSNRVRSIFQDSGGTYWIGTQYQLGLARSSSLSQFQFNEGISSNSVNAFTETGDGSFWVGTDDGLNRVYPSPALSSEFEYQTINESSYPIQISSSRVMSLLGEGDLLWVGTADGGLNRVNLRTNETKVFSHNQNDETSISGDGITSLLRSDSGQLLIGTWGAGLNVFDEETQSFRSFRDNPGNSDSISSDLVIALHQDSGGEIWIGTANGINKFQSDTSTFEYFTHDPSDTKSLSSKMAWTFHEDSSGRLWIGTDSGGLNLWRKEDREKGVSRFEHFSNKLNIASASIYAITSDEAGNIWISHNEGITKFNPLSLSIKNFGLLDGLSGNEFNHAAAYKDSFGKIYFGGNSGFHQINPANIEGKTTKPLVQLTDIRILNERATFDRPYYALNEITLDYTDYLFSIQFAVMDFTEPARNKYKYILEGFDPRWVELSESRSATYTNLPSGTYTFRVAGANSAGIWNEEGVSLDFIVLPPPWRTWWAYAIYTLLALALIATLLRNQRRKELLSLERQRELEIKVEERTHDLKEARTIAEGASAAKSAFLATMTHEIRTPMHGMIGMTELLLNTKLNEEQKRFASAAHQSGTSLLTLINEILDYSKLEATKVALDQTEFDLVELLDEVCYLQGEPAARKGLALNNISARNTPRRVTCDPTKVRQIILNLLSNAIKFTDTGHVNVKCSLRGSKNEHGQSEIAISVSDTGIGMDQETQKRVFEAFTQADTSTTRKYGGTGLGLAISKQYVELLGGKLKVSSQKGTGTTISVFLPMLISSDAVQQPTQFAEKVLHLYSSDEFTAEMLISKAQRTGMETKWFSSLDASISNLEKPDVQVIDYSLLDAYSDSEHIHQSKQKPIVILPINAKISEDSARIFVQLSTPVTHVTFVEAVMKSWDVSSEIAAEPASDLSSFSDRKRPKILVAEDVVTNQKIALEMIQLLGCEVDIATNGIEAVDMFLSDRYDLIFMDCQMPEMDGYMATVRIREIEKDKSIVGVPIVALTAGFSEDDRNRCEECGMNHYLSKPFKLQDLENVLNYFSIELKGLKAESKDKLDKHAPNDEIVNISAVENIREIERRTGNKILDSIFLGFIEQMDEKLANIQTHIRAEDTESLYKTAHAIKSMSANIGAERIMNVSKTIEQLGRKGEIPANSESYELLKIAYSEFVGYFPQAFELELRD